MKEYYRVAWFHSLAPNTGYSFHISDQTVLFTQSSLSALYGVWLEGPENVIHAPVMTTNM